MARGRALPRRIGPVDGYSDIWDDYVAWYAPSDFWAPHEPDDPAKLEEIKESLRSHGWAGRPLLALRREEHPQLAAQTGSHRLAAASAIGLDAVPVVVVTPHGDIDPKLLPDIEMIRAYAENDDHQLAIVAALLWDLDY